MQNDLDVVAVDDGAIESSIEEINEGLDQINEGLSQNKDLIDAYHTETTKQINDLVAEQRKVDTENEEADQDQTQVYMEILQDMSDQIHLSNEIFAGQIFMLGILTGVVLFKILFDRFKV